MCANTDWCRCTGFDVCWNWKTNSSMADFVIVLVSFSRQWAWSDGSSWGWWLGHLNVDKSCHVSSFCRDVRRCSMALVGRGGWRAVRVRRWAEPHQDVWAVSVTMRRLQPLTSFVQADHHQTWRTSTAFPAAVSTRMKTDQHTVYTPEDIQSEAQLVYIDFETSTVFSHPL